MLLHPLVEEWDAGVLGDDPLAFPGYRAQLARAGGEAVLTGKTDHYALVQGRFEVLGGSMGAAVGERVVRAYRRAVDARLPVVAVVASGGARMQEGMVALVQMARTATAARAHAAAGLLSLAVYRPPTTGGVFASYASLVDVRAAQPGATVGFAGPRVVEETLGERLPEGSHTAESAYAAGLVDALVAPNDQARWVDVALGHAEERLVVRPLPSPRGRPTTASAPGPAHGGEADDGGAAWEEVRRARATGRPSGIDHAARLCSSWTELRGRDPVVRAGLATACGRRVVVLATDRYAGDGRPRPAGYRLAQRAVALAARLGLPVLSFVDTPGAHPGPASEADGIAAEIARTFAAMADLPTVSVAVCVGEGGSGGALALAHADRLLVQEHAIFSVIAPEGAAAILHRDARLAPSAAARLKLTSGDLVALGVADEVVPERADDSARAVDAAVENALAQAAPGDRARRVEEATRRWLR